MEEKVMESKKPKRKFIAGAKRIILYGLIFGTVAAVTGILIGAYDFYLINFTSGISNGLLAVFLMIIVIPVIVVLLIIDIIVYLVKRHRNKAS